jgi:hypothetical protein
MLSGHAPYGKREHHINQEKKKVCDCVQLERKKRDVGCIFRVCGNKKPK